MRRVGRQGSWNLWDPGQQTVGAQRGLQPLGNSQSQGRVHNWGLCFPCLGCRTDMESIRQFQKLGEPGRAHKLSCSLARETQVCGGGRGGSKSPRTPWGWLLGEKAGLLPEEAPWGPRACGFSWPAGWSPVLRGAGGRGAPGPAVRGGADHCRAAEETAGAASLSRSAAWMQGPAPSAQEVTGVRVAQNRP